VVDYKTLHEPGWCLECDSRLPDRRHWRTMFCNKDCNNAYFNKLTADARREAREKLRCEECGEPIMNAKKSDTRFCGKPCWRKNWNRGNGPG
jgi:hypothetical protein